MMFNRILLRIKEKIRRREYVMTPHARKEMNSDDLTIYDVERGILTGEVMERQKDRETSEWKYRIKGSTFGSDDVEIIAKISPTGKLVIITVFLS